MAISMPYFVGDSCLTANLAQLAFEQFVKNLPGVAPLMIAAAFNDLMTAIRHPYNTGLQDLTFEREVDRRVREAEVASVRKELDMVQTQRQSLQAVVESAQRERQSLQGQLQDLRNYQQSLQGQLQVSHVERQSLRSQLQAVEVELQSRQILFETELKSAQSETKTAFTLLEERTKASAASHKAMIENLDSQIAFLRREILELRSNDGIDTTGSKSRSETWTNVKNANPNRMSLPLAASPVLPDHQTFAIEQLVAARYQSEKDMYRPFISVVGPILNSARTVNTLGAQVIDTHNRQFLGVYSPDITVAIGGLQHPDSASVYMVIELKHTNVTLEGKGLGQAYDYSLAIRAAQGHRRFHVVMLSNFIDTHFVMLDTKDSSTRHFIATNLAHAISYIKHRVLSSTEFSPNVPAYSLGLGDMVRRLGTSKHSVVSEFDAPDGMAGTLSRLFIGEQLGTTMAVKRSSNKSKAGDIAHEIYILTKIKMCSGASTIARLVHTSPQNDELGVMPVGARVNSLELPEHTAITILTDVLSAIVWLHSKNILHRDIRIDNVVLHDGHARLIDFGAAIELPAQPDTPYWGGYLCCPQELIGDFNRPYTPAKKHDLLAYVMMAALMAFPHSLKSISSKHVSQHTPESYRLIRYWARLRTSCVWRPFVTAAETVQYAGLETIGDVFAIL